MVVYLLHPHCPAYPPAPVVQQHLLGQGRLIIEVSRSHSETPHSVGLLWTSEQPYNTTLARQRSMLPVRFESEMLASE